MQGFLDFPITHPYVVLFLEDFDSGLYASALNSKTFALFPAVLLQKFLSKASKSSGSLQANTWHMLWRQLHGAR